MLDNIAEWSRRCPAVKYYKPHRTHRLDEDGKQHLTEEGKDWERLINFRARAESTTFASERLTCLEKYRECLEEVKTNYGYIHPRVIVLYPDLGVIEFQRTKNVRSHQVGTKRRYKKRLYTAPKRPSEIRELRVNGRGVVSFREWLLNHLTYASIFGPGASVQQITHLSGALAPSIRSAMFDFRAAYDCTDPKATSDRPTRRIQIPWRHTIPGHFRPKITVYRVNQVPVSRRLVYQPAIPVQNLVVAEAVPQQRQFKFMVPCDETGKVIAGAVACEFPLSTVSFKSKESSSLDLVAPTAPSGPLHASE